MKKILGLILATILVICVMPAKSSFANDIANHQMKTELTYWAKKNVILPDANGNYHPNKKVTRGEFASYITRALELPANSSKTFKDIPAGTTLANEISAAAAAGILSGYEDGTFKPNQLISRQHMAAMLHNSLMYKKIPAKTATLNFVDKNQIFSQFKTAVASNVYYNIIRGSSTAKGVYFNPKDNATIAQAAAFLYRMNNVVSSGASTTPEEKPVDKPVEDNKTYYYTGIVNNGKVVKHDTKYKSYEDAVNAYDDNKSITLVLKNNTILKTRNNSIVYVTDRTSSGDTATIYLDNTLKSSFTYVAEGTELDYLGSNEKYTVVKVGDVIGYAKTSEITIQPVALLKGRSYYTISNGSLNHNIYDHAKQSYSGEYQVGNAPSFMKAGEKYYSLDGVHFYTDAGKLAGTYFNYYQFASIRKYTEYTAKELDNIINVLLAERERINPTKYKNATTKSKIIGLGAFLKEIEAEYKVNALFILSTAMHESDYGMSTNAQTKNNLFGIRVFDSTPEAGSKYKTPQDSVYAFMNEYINKNYVPQSGNYANGAVPGNKNTGITVYYASDAFWGSKNAGHMYRIDERFGKKEYKSAETIGMVLNGGKAVPAYVDPSTSSKVMYTYKAKPIGESGLFGFPVIIMEEQKDANGKTWYKVFSDNHPKGDNFTRFVWIPAEHIKIINAQ